MTKTVEDTTSELDTLFAKFKNAKDLLEKKHLLEQFRVLLAEADRLVARDILKGP